MVAHRAKGSARAARQRHHRPGAHRRAAGPLRLPAAVRPVEQGAGGGRGARLRSLDAQSAGADAGVARRVRCPGRAAVGDADRHGGLVARRRVPARCGLPRTHHGGALLPGVALRGRGQRGGVGAARGRQQPGPHPAGGDPPGALGRPGPGRGDESRSNESREGEARPPRAPGGPARDPGAGHHRGRLRPRLLHHRGRGPAHLPLPGVAPARTRGARGRPAAAPLPLPRPRAAAHRHRVRGRLREARERHGGGDAARGLDPGGDPDRRTVPRPRLRPDRLGPRPARAAPAAGWPRQAPRAPQPPRLDRPGHRAAHDRAGAARRQGPRGRAPLLGHRLRRLPAAPHQPAAPEAVRRRGRGPRGRPAARGRGLHRRLRGRPGEGRRGGARPDGRRADRLGRGRGTAGGDHRDPGTVRRGRRPEPDQRARLRRLGGSADHPPRGGQRPCRVRLRTGGRVEPRPGPRGSAAHGCPAP